MLNSRAYENPVPGVWGTFDRERKRLNMQMVKPCFIDETGLGTDELFSGFQNLKNSLSAEPAIIRKAFLFEYLLLNGRITIDPEDWFADKLDHQGLMMEYNTSAMVNIPKKYVPEIESNIKTAALTGYYETGLDVGHVSPGWRYMFSKGLSGLLRESKTYRNNYGNKLTQEQTDFYDSLEIVYNAIITFANRLSHLAGTLVGKFGDATDVRLLTVSDSLKYVPENPPRDFHEALQFTFIMHQMIELEGEWVRSMGGFDRNFFDYYKQDIETGILTIPTAKELIKFFFTKFYANTRGANNGKNFYFGGQLRDGSNAENDLTYLTLEVYNEMNTTDPKLSVRFYKDSTQRLYNLVAETIRAGRTGFVLINDEVAVPAIQSSGKNLEDARDYLLIGCYEPAIEGKEIACNMSISLNLAKSIELVLYRGIDKITGIPLGPDTGDPILFTSYEQFENAYFTQLENQITSATESVRNYEKYWSLMNPSPVLAGTFENALKTGKDIGQSGPEYNNTGCMGAGLATTVDSLSAIKKVVFEDKTYTMADIFDALNDNFSNQKKLLLYLLNRIPRWGNGEIEADNIAKRVVDFYSENVSSQKNSRGGKFVPSLFSLVHNNSLGKGTSTLPDGRLKSEPLSLNNTANIGKDKNGVTALLKSLTRLDYRKLPNGSVSDVYLHPSAILGEEGLNAFISLIKTYFKLGGYGIQFNIFDTDTLIDAQKNPEKYQTLQIRVCGWNVYFVTMSFAEQERYIKANVHY